MSIRPVKQVIEAEPHMEGAGVHLHRAFGFGKTDDFDPFLLFDDFRNDDPSKYRAGFPGTPIAASRRSPTCWLVPSSTATAWATRAPWAPEMYSG